MTAKDRFSRSTRNLFAKMGNDGTLHVPTGTPDYDPDTGDVTTPETTHPIKYTNLPLETNKNSDEGLSAFLEGFVTFYVDDISVVVNETCYIEGK